MTNISVNYNFIFNKLRSMKQHERKQSKFYLTHQTIEPTYADTDHAFGLKAFEALKMLQNSP